MEPSPLTQDSRPEIFQPKIISLYETLFKVCPLSPSPAHLRQQCANAKGRPRKMTKMSNCPRDSGKNSFSTAPIQPA